MTREVASGADEYLEWCRQMRERTIADYANAEQFQGGAAHPRPCAAHPITLPQSAPQGAPQARDGQNAYAFISSQNSPAADSQGPAAGALSVEA